MNITANNKSIDLLNKAVGDELSAIHQYLYFHFHCDDQGLDPLANLFKRIAIVEMSHVEKLAERILFLKGDVNMKITSAVESIKSVEQMLEKARKMENQSAVEYNEWANECSENNDAISKTLFESLLADEEKHFQQFDIQLENIKKFGPNYLALQSMSAIEKEAGK